MQKELDKAVADIKKHRKDIIEKLVEFSKTDVLFFIYALNMRF